MPNFQNTSGRTVRSSSVLENNPQMIKGHAASKETLLQNWDRNGFLPFHPGAIRYFKEKGITVPKHLIPPEYKG